MPQLLLPMIPAGASRISDVVTVVRENGEWTYFCGVQPIFRHSEEDRRSFRMFTAHAVHRTAMGCLIGGLRLDNRHVTAIRTVNRPRRFGITMMR